jgi:hypothetical protein
MNNTMKDLLDIFERRPERMSETFDGRPSVDVYEEDPLLAQLLAVHGEPRFDIYPGLTRGVKDHA